MVEPLSSASAVVGILLPILKLAMKILDADDIKQATSGAIKRVQEQVEGAKVLLEQEERLWAWIDDNNVSMDQGLYEWFHTTFKPALDKLSTCLEAVDAELVEHAEKDSKRPQRRFRETLLTVVGKGAPKDKGKVEDLGTKLKDSVGNLQKLLTSHTHELIVRGHQGQVVAKTTHPILARLEDLTHMFIEDTSCEVEFVEARELNGQVWKRLETRMIEAGPSISGEPLGGRRGSKAGGFPVQHLSSVRFKLGVHVQNRYFYIVRFDSRDQPELYWPKSSGYENEIEVTLGRIFPDYDEDENLNDPVSWDLEKDNKDDPMQRETVFFIFAKKKILSSGTSRPAVVYKLDNIAEILKPEFEDDIVVKRRIFNIL